MKNFIYLILLLTLGACAISDNERQEISLNGSWELTSTDNQSDIPTVFESKVPVPG